MTQKIGKRQKIPHLNLSADLDHLDTAPSILVRTPADLDAVADHSQDTVVIESDMVTRPILEQILKKLRRYPEAQLRFEDTDEIRRLRRLAAKAEDAVSKPRVKRSANREHVNALARAARIRRKAAANAGK